MRNFLRLFVLTLALAASALTLAPGNAFAACTHGDTMVVPGRCCSVEGQSYRIHLLMECINGGWRVVDQGCSSEPCWG